MTTPPRDCATRLFIALAITSGIMASAIALPGAALAEGGQFDKMRAKIAALQGTGSA